MSSPAVLAKGIALDILESKLSTFSKSPSILFDWLCCELFIEVTSDVWRSNILKASRFSPWLFWCQFSAKKTRSSNGFPASTVFGFGLSELGSVCKILKSDYTGRHGKSWRSNQWTMGADWTVASESKYKTWQTSARSSATPEWCFVGAENRYTLARFARAIWQVANDLQLIPALAQVKQLGQDVCWIADFPRCAEQCGLESSFHWLDHRACSSTFGWGKKGSAKLETLDRSCGESTTKIHIRCDGTGRLITFCSLPVKKVTSSLLGLDGNWCCS